MNESPQKLFWADQMALEIRARIEGEARLKDLYDSQGLLVYDEKTPSGIIHIGSGRGWLIHDVIAKALRNLGMNARFVLSSDDYDPYDKPFPGVDPYRFNRYLGMPFCDIPSPVDGCSSFGDYFFRQATDRFKDLGIECAFESTADNYRRGVFNGQIRTILDNADKVQAVYLDLYGPESEGCRKMPFNMKCPACGKIATTLADKWDREKGLLHFRCASGVVAWAEGCGYEGWASPYDGGGKFPWKVEWAAKWPARGVLVEFGGKDHFSKGGSRTCANRIAVDVLGFPPPYPSSGYATGPGYEFFQIGGAKMSTSKGTGMSFAEGVAFFPPEMFRHLLLRHKPNSVVNFDPAKNDIILLAEHYDRAERIRFGSEPAEEDEKALQTRLYELSAAGVAPDRLMPQVPLTLASTSLQTVLSVPSAISQLQAMGHLPPSLTDPEMIRIERRFALAGRWLERYAGEQFVFRLVDEKRPCDALSETQCGHVEAFCACLEEVGAGIGDKGLHDRIYEFARGMAVEPKELFRTLYLALIAKDRGPQMASFILTMGVPRAVSLMRISVNASRKRGETPGGVL